MHHSFIFYFVLFFFYIWIRSYGLRLKNKQKDKNKNLLHFLESFLTSFRQNCWLGRGVVNIFWKGIRDIRNKEVILWHLNDESMSFALKCFSLCEQIGKRFQFLQRRIIIINFWLSFTFLLIFIAFFRNFSTFSDC